MSEPKPGQFITQDDTLYEEVVGRSHYWYTRPDKAPGSNIMSVRVTVPVGMGHPFHHHPNMEELLYVLSGTAEQWLEKEKRMLHAGDLIQIRPGVVHATYNGGDDELVFLAILSPADSEPPGTVQVEDQEPWKSLRPA